MDHQYSQRIYRCERLIRGYVLEVEGHAVGNPVGCLLRSNIAAIHEERATWTANPHFNGLCTGNVPRNGGSTVGRTGSNWKWIRTCGERDRPDRRLTACESKANGC